MLGWIFTIESIGVAVRRLEAKLDDLNTKVDELLANVAKAQDGIVAVETDVGQVSSLVTDLRNQLASGGTVDVSGAIAKLDQANAALSAMADKLTVIDSGLDAATGVVNT